MKIYQNIGVLNLSKAKDPVLEEIHKLENIGLLITSKDQTEKLGHIEMENIGDQAVIDGKKDIGMVIRNGILDIKKSFLEDSEKEIFFIVNGIFSIEEMPGEHLRKIHGIVLNGEMVAPEKVYGVLSDRLKINGEVLTYPEGFLYLKGDFTLQEEHLLGLQDQSKVAVATLKMLEEVDTQLVEDKIEKMVILKELITTKNNLRWIAPRVENYTEVAKTIVPEGYDYYEKLTISDENLSSFTNRKIFVKRKLKIDLPFEKIKGHISDIKGKALYVPEGEREAYLEVAEGMEIKTFNPKAVENYAKLEVDSGYLKGRESIEIENYGVLEVKEEVTEELLDLGIKRIKNYGKIQCPKKIYALLSQKVTENYGVIDSKSDRPVKVEETAHTKVSNMGVLIL
jgi:hypothetical protein